MAAVTAVKSTDIAGVVRSLDSDSLDVLMKYLYAGMASPEKYNAGSLLAWHEVVRPRRGCVRPPRCAAVVGPTGLVLTLASWSRRSLPPHACVCLCVRAGRRVCRTRLPCARAH